MFEETHLRESCTNVIVELSPTSLELINPISHTLLELVFTPFISSPPSPSLESSLLKNVEKNMMINLNDDLGLVDIEIERVEREG